MVRAGDGDLRRFLWNLGVLENDETQLWRIKVGGWSMKPECHHPLHP